MSAINNLSKSSATNSMFILVLSFYIRFLRSRPIFRFAAAAAVVVVVVVVVNVAFVVVVIAVVVVGCCFIVVVASVSQ